MDPVADVTLSGPWLSDPQVQRVLAVMNSHGEEARIVGGAVRNALLNRPIADVDIATTALPEETMKRMAGAGFVTVPTGLKHGTILVILDRGGVEITTLREDVETDGRHAVVAFGRSWYADASRRDFTMNALYCGADGRIYDPIGGLGDCQTGIVRFIGDPDQRLSEDYLRLLRFFRFTADYAVGAPDPAGLAACIRARNGLARISVERIAQESRKLFPAGGAVAACRIFAASGLAQPAYGAAPNPAVFGNLVSLAHSISQPVRFETALAAYLCHGSDDADRLARYLKVSNAERAFLRSICRLGFGTWHGRAPKETDLTHAVVASGKDIAVQALLLAASRLESRGAGAGLAEKVAFVDAFNVPAFPLRGRDLQDLGLRSGPKIGALLERARILWRDENYGPPRDVLLERIRQWIGQSK